MEKVFINNQWELAELLQKFPQLDDGILQYPKLPLTIGEWKEPFDSRWTGSCTNGHHRIITLVYFRGEWKKLDGMDEYHSNYSDDSSYRVFAKPIKEQIVALEPAEDLLIFCSEHEQDHTLGQDVVNESRAYFDIIPMETILQWKGEIILEAKKKMEKLQKANFCLRAKIKNEQQ